VPARLPTDDDFSTSGPALARVYEQAWLACRLIAQRAGRTGLVRFYRRIGTALTTGPQAVAGAFQTVLHESERAFTDRWRRYLKTVLS
jgi:hypothetical protein